MSAAKQIHLQSHQGQASNEDHKQQHTVDVLSNQRISKTHEQPNNEVLGVSAYTFKKPNHMVNDSVGIDCGGSHYACEDDKTCCPSTGPNGAYKCCPSQSSIDGGLMRCCKAGMDVSGQYLLKLPYAAFYYQY